MRSSLFWLVLSVLLSGAGLLTIALVDLVGAVQDADQRALGQAREGARKEIKVAAIASLGTLPFLVQMMGDADAQIAAAAKAAVDKINSKPPDKK